MQQVNLDISNSNYLIKPSPFPLSLSQTRSQNPLPFPPIPTDQTDYPSHCMASTQTPPETAAIPDEPQVEAELPEPKEEDAEPSTVETPSTEATAPDDKDKALDEIKAKWPGWPGYSVFRLLVPVLKVGGIIGRKGDLIKKLVEETRARVRVLDGPITSPDRIVILLIIYLSFFLLPSCSLANGACQFQFLCFYFLRFRGISSIWGLLMIV